MNVVELEDVFNEAAFPEYTFVEPKEYRYIISSVKSKGKHITVSGASGTGKTTLVKKVLRELNISDSDILWINGRQYSEHDSGLQLLAEELSSSSDFNELTSLMNLVKFIIIDDFHFLKSGARLEIASKLKLWHEKDVRFIIIGIAASAEELHGVDAELGIRNDPFEIKTQDETFCRTLLEKGCDVLAVSFSEKLKKEIIQSSNGVPSIVHVIAKVCCINSDINQTQSKHCTINSQLVEIRNDVLRIFHGKYRDKVVGLAKGKQQAKSVHHTYFDIVSNIARIDSSEIPTETLYSSIVASISEAKERKKKATSFYNCLNNLSDVIEQKGLADIIFYKKGGKYISIEDPSFRFYLNLLDINDIKSRIHLRNSSFTYDVAVSFAGDVRDTVEKFVEELKERGITVFYDFDQQAQLWGSNLREKLADVYANDALFMVVFLSKSYPEKDWTDFELSIGKRASQKRDTDYLLPLLIDNVPVVGIKSTTGYLNLNNMSIEKVADVLAEKIEESGIK
ncbi:TIR domain-containing protein [Waterburya agarophytonicola K14]|uniref:TIR domain-containing protein n=1 Tax=Waterburya agarophytonicola KI4 TaxID=2874699 RepID=A0A964BWL5_9CYAN|nr:TIR domain-containing protein [Waterburya agarophytonicola]MCC0179087.1 TIR domain-containing protein [Waterburya agarophytonicola KI4]